jgi:succinoglycan biosynthesis transport protein ExoP
MAEDVKSSRDEHGRCAKGVSGNPNARARRNPEPARSSSVPSIGEKQAVVLRGTRARRSDTIDDSCDPVDFQGGVGQVESDTVELREILLKLWRRRWAIAALTLLFAGASGAIAILMTPEYAGEVYLAINPVRDKSGDRAGSDSGTSPETLQTEQYVLRSREMAEATVEQLGLDRDSELDPGRSAGLLQRSFRMITGGLEDGRSNSRATAHGEQHAAPPSRTTIMENYLKRLKVTPIERSRVVLIAYTSSNPETAARVANTVAELYIRRLMQSKAEGKEQARKALSARLVALEKHVISSEMAVEDYRRKTGLSPDKSSSLVTQKMAELNTQLVLAQAKRADAEARVAQLETLSAAPETADAMMEVLTSSSIQRLRDQEDIAQGRVTSLSLIYTDQHPKVIEAQAQLNDAKAALRSEIVKTLQGVRNEFAIAKTREESLRRSLSELRGEVERANDAEVELHALERKAAVERSIYERLLELGEEAEGNNAIPVADAAILSPSAVPTAPISPNRKMIVLIGLVGGLVVGSAYAFTAEQFVGGLRTKTQVERMLSLRCLAQIPTLRGRRRRQNPRSYMLRSPGSAFAEAMRGLYISLLMSDCGRTHRIILVASALPQEGKTSSAACLASCLAVGGHRVLLVDCDLHRPAAHRHLMLPSGPGLIELLRHEATPAEVICRDDASGADFLATGLRRENSRGTFASSEMQAVLRDLAAQYDFVVLDSAAVLAAAETVILAQIADVTLFVVQWGTTSSEVAKSALEQLAYAGGAVLGVLLSKVNVKQLGKYGDASYGVQRKLAKYYRTQ